MYHIQYDAYGYSIEWDGDCIVEVCGDHPRDIKRVRAIAKWHLSRLPDADSSPVRFQRVPDPVLVSA